MNNRSKLSEIIKPEGLDPARKLLALALFSIAVSLLSSSLTACIALAFAFLYAMLCGLDKKTLRQRIFIANFFFIFLWIFLPLRFEIGNINSAHRHIWAFGPLYFDPNGFALAALITIKGNAAVLAILALAGTSSSTNNGHALVRLKVPEKLACLVLLTQKHLEVLALESTRLQDAAKLRGFHSRTNFSSYRTYAWLVSVLFIRAWGKSERVAKAMRLRGFSGKFPLIDSLALSEKKIQASNLLLKLSIILSLLLFFSDLLIKR